MYSTGAIRPPEARDSAGRLLSPAAFAKASGVSLSTVWRRLRRRELPSVKRGGKRLIPAEALVKRTQSPAIFDEKHPMWRLVGAAKSGGAGPGSSDKHRYLDEEAAGRR
jgi:excisionase family DNA binding protein